MDESLVRSQAPEIHIVFVTNSMDPGGTERNIQVLAENLPSSIRREIWSLLPAPSGLSLTCTLTTQKRLTKFDPLLVLNLYRQLKHHPAKILHIFHFALGIHVLAANLMLRRKCRKKMVFSFGSARTTSRSINWYVRQVGKHADWVTGNSHSVVQSLAAQGIPTGILEVLPNGHDLRLYQGNSTKSQLRAMLQLDPQATILITTGRLTATKRHVDLLDAFQMLSQKHPELQLMVLGDGELLHELQEQARALGVARQVLFLGNRPSVIDYLIAADVFVFPSETEGLPNSLIEASLASLPIVACDVVGVTDVVQHDENGLLVGTRSPQAIAEAVEKFLIDPELGSRLGREARSRAAKRFGLEHVIGQVQQMYRRVLGLGAPAFPSDPQALDSQ